MAKLVLLLGAVLIIEASCQRYIFPTYRPPTQRPIIIRTVRETNGEGDDVQRTPVTGDHPNLPPVRDFQLDQYQRYVRSVDSPSAKRGGGSHRTSSGSRNTGPTHPGHNRRNARSLQSSPSGNPDSIRPRDPFDPFGPGPRDNSRGTVVYRKIRAVQTVPKPSHRDIIIPNWNPNARVKPWETIGVRRT